MARYSGDHGRSWTEPTLFVGRDGNEVLSERDNPHASLLRLSSGKLGLVYCGPSTRPGRDGSLCFRVSDDDCRTWSAPVLIDPSALCRSGCARVLRTGRIVVPTFTWFSPDPGGASELGSASFCFSWIWYSDDEGKTWKKSKSEIFVNMDGMRRGAYSFEEPTLEELKNGHLLMFGRTELGCQYQTVSADGGVSWSEPKPVRLAGSYTPSFLIRIPATGDLLQIWNQVSTEEILNGLSRHRLSTAISKDDGVTWTHFRNLESLDGRVRLQWPLTTQVFRMPDGEYGLRVPVDRERYPRAGQSCLRICYPTVAFWQNEVAITYDYGYGGPGELKAKHLTKLKIVSLDWLYLD